MEWQPIETAPKDGSLIVACRDESGRRGVSLVFWFADEWSGYTATHEVIAASFPPTHWYPIPEPM